MPRYTADTADTSNTPRGCFPRKSTLRINMNQENKVPADDVLPTPKAIDSNNETHDYEASSEKTISNSLLSAVLFLLFFALIVGAYGWYQNTEIIGRQKLQIEFLQDSFNRQKLQSKFWQGSFYNVSADLQTCGMDHIDLNSHCRKQFDNSTKVIQNNTDIIGNNTEVIRRLKINLTDCGIKAVQMVAQNITHTLKTKKCQGPEKYVWATANVRDEETGCTNVAGLGSAVVADAVTSVWCSQPYLPGGFLCVEDYYAQNKVKKFKKDLNAPEVADSPAKKTSTSNAGRDVGTGGDKSCTGIFVSC